MRTKQLFFILTGLVVLVSAGALAQHAPAQKTAAGGDEASIREMYERYERAVNSRDVNAVMRTYWKSPHLFVFDAVPPREYAGWDAYKRDWEALFAGYPGAAHAEVEELGISVAGSVAYTHNVQAGYFTRKDGTRLDWVIRVTDVLRKIGGEWVIVQEHVSFPVDLESGKADLLSKK